MLVDEVVSMIAPRATGVYVDCTVGNGGHTRALVAAGAGRVIGMDRDQDALALARVGLRDIADRVELVHDDYRHIVGVLTRLGIACADGVVADLGVSSMQLDDAARGFSFR